MKEDVDLISILYSALENALYRMEEMELQMEGEWGLGKNLTSMEKMVRLVLY
jgi:hypothetical protein